jgi:hypothetical protein
VHQDERRANSRRLRLTHDKGRTSRLNLRGSHDDERRAVYRIASAPYHDERRAVYRILSSAHQDERRAV